MNARLKWKLRLELKPRTRIVFSTFGIGEWQPESNAPVVTIALYQRCTAGWPKLMKALRVGTRIVSYAAGFESWIPTRVARPWDGKLLYLYEAVAGQSVGPARR